MTDGKILRVARGATTVDVDSAELITAATREMLQLLVARNDVAHDVLVNALFTVTPDLHAAFPALAARQLGWLDVPLLCATEIAVPDALPRCVRVMLHFHSRRARADVVHVYLGDARRCAPTSSMTERSRRRPPA
jgi:chorismate mutase